MEQKLLDVAEVENYLPILFAEIHDIKQGKLISFDEIVRLKTTATELLIYFLAKKEAITDNFHSCLDEIDASLDIVKACIHGLSGQSA